MLKFTKILQKQFFCPTKILRMQTNLPIPSFEDLNFLNTAYHNLRIEKAPEPKRWRTPRKVTHHFQDQNPNFQDLWSSFLHWIPDAPIQPANRRAQWGLFRPNRPKIFIRSKKRRLPHRKKSQPNFPSNFFCVRGIRRNGDPSHGPGQLTNFDFF